MQPVLRLVSNDASSGRGGRDVPVTHKPGNGSERKSTLLIVEDEILIRLTISDYLRNCGFRVLEASNAGEALSVFAAGEPIELVFSDVSMPGRMNGGDLAHWIRQHFPDVKVLLTSTDAALAMDGSSAADGAVVRKPYSTDVVLAEIRRLLRA